MSQRQSLPTNGSGKKAGREGCLTRALSGFGRVDVARRTSIVLRSFARLPELLFEFLQLFIREVLEVDEFIARVFNRANEFVQFQMNCLGVSILGVLNQKYHQEGDNGRSGVYDQLPRVGKVKNGASNQPDDNDQQSCSKCPGAAEQAGGTPRKNTECIADDAKKNRVLVRSFLVFRLESLAQCHLNFERSLKNARIRLPITTCSRPEQGD